jgi:hypothetical protein
MGQRTVSAQLGGRDLVSKKSRQNVNEREALFGRAKSVGWCSVLLSLVLKLQTQSLQVPCGIQCLSKR